MKKFENSQEALESLVDTQGLAEVVRMLAQIASDKAEHVRHAYQDEALAKTWDRKMMLLDNFSSKL